MRTAPGVVLFCLVSLCSAIGQPLRLQGSKIVFPTGQVIGAALSESLIFVQESVFHPDGPIIHVSRRVLAWNLTTNSVMKEKTLGTGDSVLVGNDCATVEAIDAGRHIMVCENYETLVILDGQTLDPVSRVHCDGRIYDFAVDESSKRVLLASSSGSQIQYLTVFDVASGKKLSETKISSGAVDQELVVVDSRTKRVAVAQSHLDHSGYKTKVYGCEYTSALTCSQVAALGQVSQISIWGTDVFLASGLYADDRRVCLTSVNLNTHAVGHQYCSQTGVHYGVAVIDGKYVIAFTGVAKNLAWKEIVKPVSNSVAVWRYENGTVAAQAVQDGGDAHFQPGARIASSKSSPRFLLYGQTSNVAYVYSINEAPAR